jgi:flagellar motility protein MotE (MotC chaperone)
MDAKKAAKIILTYSDNIAKDIVYSMKKKKAAEILAQLNPETVNRITRVK